MSSWQDICHFKRELQAGNIPFDWRLKSIPEDYKSSIPIVESCGVLNAEELEITNTDASILVSKLQTGELTSVKVVTAFCKRAAVLQQLTKCCTELMFSDAIETAERLDEEFAKTGRPTGPLHGLPISLKDCCEVEGYDTCVGWAGLCFKPAEQDTTIMSSARASIPFTADLSLVAPVRNYTPAHEMIAKGDWNVAAVAKNEYDLENKVVGTVAVGRIGERVLRRLKAFDCKELLYFDYQPLSPEKEAEIGCRRVDKLEDMLAQCDIVTINCPLHEKTKGLFNKELISKMKKGSWLVNTARGAIVVKEDVAEALKSGQLRGYGGDVWDVQPAPKEHPLRTASYSTWGGGNATVPHMSGTSIDAQKRYAAGTKSLLESYFSGKHDYKPEDLIVQGGDYATKAYGERKQARQSS
ncbi:hypothetical protein JADG_010372 [Aureobasidium aubasidani]|nr:hypothetical protein JADG_010372 [Aureobasidium pullulans]